MTLTKKPTAIEDRRTVARNTDATLQTVPLVLNVAFVNSATTASLMRISESTLRNYVWLQGLTRQERARRFLQDPPPKMPRPKKVRGRLLWDAKILQNWLNLR